MYLRATMVTVAPDRVDDLVHFVEDEVRPTLAQQSGSRGLAMGVDRESGECTIVSFWDDLDTLRASDSGVARQRDTAAQRFGATFDVNVMEVPEMRMLEQPRPGCWNRVSMLDVSASEIDAAVDAFRISTLPALEALPGFCAGMLAVDREHERAVAVTTWRDRDALRASTERANALREEVRDKTRGTITAVLEREVVISERS